MSVRKRDHAARQRLHHVAWQWAGYAVDRASSSLVEDPTQWDACLASEREVLTDLG